MQDIKSIGSSVIGDEDMRLFMHTLMSGAGGLGMELSDDEVKTFASMYQELMKFNESINLTSIIKPEEFAVKHILDSLLCSRILHEMGSGQVVDVGTGAGFPGLPLAIHYPCLHFTLVESVGKKADYVRYISDLLGLENVQVIQARAEELGRQGSHREKYDVAMARGVAMLSILVEYCLPLVKVGGIFIAMKGPGAQEEIANASRALGETGGEIEKVDEITLPLGQVLRRLVVIRKQRPCPARYPRRPGIPAKKPL